VGGRPSTVRSAVLACARHRTGHELDVVVGQQRPGEADIVLAIGEAKCTSRPVGQAELDRLEHLRELIPGDRVASPPRLLLFSRGGFTTGLRHAVSVRRDVDLVDLERLYRGE
jgi:hypothetical protein